MLKNTFLIVVFLIITSVSLANPISSDLNLNTTSLDKILNIGNESPEILTAWSPDGQYLLVTYYSNIHTHYLLDMNSHTWGEIDYGIKDSETNHILDAKWAPSGDKIYFRVSKADRTNSGICYIICNPDGTNLRCVGTNYTDLSTVMANIGNIGFQNNLKWGSDSGKIVFEWQKPGNVLNGVYIANGDGTNVHELILGKKPIFYDSNKIFVLDEGTLDLINENGDVIQAFQPKNENEQYSAVSLSPDRKKILIFSWFVGSSNSQTYISNIDDSNLKGRISYYDGKDIEVLTKEYWQPNGSLLLVNNNGNLYIVEGDANNRRLLYEGNASKPQWFPNGKKIAFTENKNKLYSIDTDGTNLTFITNFGLTNSFFWDMFWDPLNKAKQFSISPSGSTIVFMSALYPDTGKLIENEPQSSKFQGIAAPLFIVNSDGSNLTQITPKIKGRHYVFGDWSPDGKQFTIGSIVFTSDINWDYGENSLIELNSENSTSVWKKLPVSEIACEKTAPSTIEKTQKSKLNSTNVSQTIEHKEESKQSPSFLFLQMFSCIMGVWILHKTREK